MHTLGQSVWPLAATPQLRLSAVSPPGPAWKRSVPGLQVWPSSVSCMFVLRRDYLSPAYPGIPIHSCTQYHDQSWFVVLRGIRKMCCLFCCWLLLSPTLVSALHMWACHSSPPCTYRARSRVHMVSWLTALSIPTLLWSSSGDGCVSRPRPPTPARSL